LVCEGWVHEKILQNNGDNVNELPRSKLQGIECHAGLDPASSLDFWIPAFAGMTTRGKPRGIGPKRD